MTTDFRIVYHICLTVCLACMSYVPEAGALEHNEAIIIAPETLSSAAILPVVIRVYNGLGNLDTSLSETLSLDSDNSTFSASDISIKNGVGSVLGTIGNPDDFTLTINGYPCSAAISAPALPIVQHTNTTISDRETWTADGEHHVNGELTVTEGGELVIEEGATVLLGDRTNMTVHGTILATGSRDKPITFIAQDAALPWGGIEIRHGTGAFSYCFFTCGGADTSKSFGHSGSQPVLKIYSGSLAVDNCFFFDNTGKALGGYASDIDIDSSLLSRCDTGAEFKLCRGSVTNTYFTDMPSIDNSRVDDDNDFLYFSETYPGNEEPLLVSNCCFVHGYDDGIDIYQSSVDIRDNVFFDIADKGVSIGGGAKNVTISKCLISGTDIGVAVKDGSELAIDHTTIDDTGTGISAYIKADWAETGGTVTVTNSILSRCHSAVLKYDDNSWIDVSYSLADSEELPGTGNIHGDPKFVSAQTGNYMLQTGSPAIDTGDPEHPLDDDGTRSDMGAIAFKPLFERIVINEINYNSQDTHDPGDWVELYNPNDYSVDMSGWIFRDGNMNHSFVFPFPSVLAPRSYAVISVDLMLFSSIFPEVSPVPAEMDFGLSADGELICLINDRGVLIDSLTYDDALPWPEEADGSESTLSLINPELDNTLPESWAASKGHGTPGEVNDTFQYYDSSDNKLVTTIALGQNFPNPFNTLTTIPFILSEPGRVELEVYSVTGQKIATVMNKTMPSGHHEVTVNLGNVSSGIYIYKITTPQATKTKSMLFRK